MSQPVYEDNVNAIVIDNGTSCIKAGFAGNDAPSVEIPTIIGKAKVFQSSMVGMGQKRVFIGAEAKNKKGIPLSLSYPIERGIITNWDDMETIYQHLFNEEIGVKSCEYPVLLTDIIENNKFNRKRMTEIMFEKFNVPAMGIENQSVLALFSSGNTTGITIDSGAGGTRLVPVEEGYIINYAVRTMNIGGDDITDHMIRFMNNDGFIFKSKKDAEIVQNIKETLGYIANDFEMECDYIQFQKIKDELLCAETSPSTTEFLSQNQVQAEYKLPDGQVITVNDVRFKSPEIMFTPNYTNGVSHGLSELLHEAIMSIATEELQQVMFQNIILSGGNTLFPGFEQRLKTDFKKWNEIDIKIVAPEQRLYSVYIGGSILASLSSFQNQWMSKKQYEDEGAIMCMMNLPYE